MSNKDTTVKKTFFLTESGMLGSVEDFGISTLKIR